MLFFVKFVGTESVDWNGQTRAKNDKNILTKVKEKHQQHILTIKLTKF